MLHEHKFLFALLLTLIIEIPIFVLLVNYFCKHNKVEIYKIALIGAIASALTLPYFWFILPIYIVNRFVFIFCGEILIIFIEAFIYSQLLKLKFSKAFIISLVANIFSAFFGSIFC